jgi:hypothetical protein
MQRPQGKPMMLWVAAVLRTLKADKQLSTEMRKLNKDRREGKINLKDYIRAEEELYRARGETINRDKELIRIEQTREKNRKKEAADVERIKEKYDSAYAARKKHDREISDIEKAFGKGTDKAQKAIAVVTNEYREFVRATKNGDVIDAGNQFARFSDQAYRAQQRIKRFASVGLQQAGYQVGDFIVQIQSGQNALVALGQQGSQLAGIFGTGGAVVGAGIAAATAIGMIFFEAYKTTNNIKTMDEASSDLSSSISDLKTNLDRIADTKLDETFGNMTNSIREMSRELSKLGQLKVLRDYQASVMAISAETAGISPTRKIAAGAQRFVMDMLVMPDPRMVEKYRNDVADLYIEKWETLGIDMSRAQFDAYRKDLLYQASKGNTEEVTKITDQFIKDATDGEKGILGMSAAAQDMVFGLGNAAIAVAELTAEINGSAKAARKSAEEAKRQEEIADETLKKRIELRKIEDAATKALNDEIALLSMKKQFGEDSNTVRLLEAQIARETYEADKQREQLEPGIVEGLMRQYDVAVRLKEEMRLSAEEAGNMMDFLNRIVERNQPIKPPKKKPKGPKGPEDPAIKMLQEIERRKVLIGLTEEQAKRQELLYQTEDKLGEFREKYGNDFVNNIVNQTMALDEQQKVLDEAKAKQKEVGDLISSSMEDAFMSIVDGTKSVKDAFKSMAASIISELYRIFVIKKIVGGITGFLPFADGGVFSGGSVVPSAKGNAFYGGNVIPFANGGVVSSPMTFPMTGGKTGLMGEAGPEAIMPLKRGKGGKLGVVAENNGNVVIHQNFNFSANGDESVKKIIAQAAPQIAQMTKTSIINDRRRGGSTLAAFGR